uniref:Glutathione S-transferase kappa n=1 Tax=Mastacembelus armatus TaxID=205130 RepID=A0A7N8YJA5_9TELE
MMTSKKVVELFYDVASPYSWLGFEIICRYKNVWNIDLKFRPAFLGGVMKGSGVGRDIWGQVIQPVVFLFVFFYIPGSLSAMRFLTAVQEREGGNTKAEQVSRELFLRIWNEDKDITEPGSLSEVPAAVKAGLSESEIKELLELYTSPKMKDKLRSTTQDALDYGAFGLPLLVCHVNSKAEVFFGSDRFELMAHCIGEKWLGPQPEK